jgi:hypothetical protein
MPQRLGSAQIRMTLSRGLKLPPLADRSRPVELRWANAIKSEGKKRLRYRIHMDFIHGIRITGARVQAMWRMPKLSTQP